MSTEPLRLRDLPTEARALRQEILELLGQIRFPASRSLRLRAHDLRKRARALDKFVETALMREMAVVLAFRERMDRDPVDDDLITPEDDARALQILANFGLVGSRC